MFAPIQKLFAEYAKSIGAEQLPADESGMVTLSVGDDSTVVLIGEDDNSLLVMTPVAELPKTADYGTMLWLLRRNFYDSPIAPFRVSCDAAGSIVVWGRVPVDGMTADDLGGILEALAEEADFIRGEIATDGAA
jgi:hypothetical protein